jgi:hypothetical protein
MSKYELTEKQKVTYRVFPKTSETLNKESLIKYLNKEIEKVEREINRIGKTNTSKLTNADSNLWVTGRFRKRWLMAQLDSIIQNDSTIFYK